MKSLLVGCQSFADFVENNGCYVDKTLGIKAVMQNAAQVLLMTRPRRFGKTLFMNTLCRFFEIDPAKPGNSEANARLFSGLKVLEDQSFCDRFMGQHPVVFVSFKDVEDNNFPDAYQALARRFVHTALEFAYLQDSPRLLPQEKEQFAHYMDVAWMRDLARKDDVKTFLCDLVTFLGKHYGRKVILLIDEYDVPLAKAAAQGYYNDMIPLIRGVLSEVLKSASAANEHLLKAVLTGCLRVSKESIFTGLNNPGINTVCSEDGTLSEAIGFTEAEVKALLSYYGLESRFETVKAWYDGYRFNQKDIYCPWDVVNFCAESLTSPEPLAYRPRNYWANSSSNDVIDEFLGFLSGEDTDKMQTLVDGGTIDITVNEKLNYGDLVQHDPADFWTLLFHTGYLTIAERLPDHPLSFRVRIPNEEIRETFRTNVADHFSKVNGQYSNRGMDFVKAALAGDDDRMAMVLDELLKNYVSVRDAATKSPAENYYHGLLTSLCACAESLLFTYSSNGEAGDGYADIQFTSGVGSRRTGVVIKIKRCDRVVDLYDAADAAVEQIRGKHYAESLDKLRCGTKHAYGIAFCGRHCAVVRSE